MAAGWWSPREPVFLPLVLPVASEPHPDRVRFYQLVATRDGRAIQWRLRPEFQGVRLPAIADPRWPAPAKLPEKPEQGL